MAILEFLNVKNKDYVSRTCLQELAKSDSKSSPDKSKAGSNKKQQGRSAGPAIPLSSLPASYTVESGNFRFLTQFLKTAEPMTQMRDLVDFACKNDLKPRQALDQLVETYMAKGYSAQQHDQTLQQGPRLNNMQHQHLQNPYGSMMSSGMPQQVNGGIRTPSMNGGLPPGGNSFFSSPGYTNMSLNNATPHLAGHTPSPNHPGTMQAPSMAASQSHQGITSHSTAASSNASPSNKRRRQSTVRDGNDAVDVNGTGPSGQAAKVKASPRPGKKQKGNAS